MAGLTGLHLPSLASSQVVAGYYKQRRARGGWATTSGLRDKLAGDVVQQIILESIPGSQHDMRVRVTQMVLGVVNKAKGDASSN